MTKTLFEQLINKEDLSPAQIQDVLGNCINGQYSDLQIAAFLALMRMKGETQEELAAAATFLQQLAHPLDLGSGLIDIVGTGGDGKNTFNVSTACSFVVAAAGIPVAKHGNRSVSSRSGSADLLEEAGFVLQLDDKAAKRCIASCNLVFLFAPHYHPAMQKVRSARQQLGIRTLFNLLGPLINPAKVSRQVVGVFSQEWLKPLSTVLLHLGSTRHLVVSSEDGLDEISIAAKTRVLEYHQGTHRDWSINPKDYDMQHTGLEDIVVHSASESLALIEATFAGKKGPARDMVLLNAAAAIYCAKDDLSYAEALNMARDSLDQGKAKACFEKLRKLTQTLGTKTS